MGEILDWMNKPHDRFIAIVALAGLTVVLAVVIAAYRRG
jgi:hypothetical protein